jgi:hypothetical protein
LEQRPPERSAPYIEAKVARDLKARARALNFDDAKIDRLIGELNRNVSQGHAYAAHALLRAILDHVPPMLGFHDFKALANNYPWSRTDRMYATRLNDFKLQADDALHRQISRRNDLLGIDDLPPRVWVNTVLQECAAGPRPG